MTIQLTTACFINGSLAASGSQHTLDEATEAGLIYQGMATRVGSAPDQGGVVNPAFVSTASGSPVLMGPDGAILKGVMVSGAWFSTPSVFRLRITGTGTVTVDAKDALDNITLSVASYTASGATDQIEFPYAGDNAIAIRATLTGTTTVEVI